MANQINDNGYRVETLVENWLRESKISFIKRGNYTRWNGRNGKMDFIMVLRDRRRVFIEVKGQKGGGSVEDKYLTSLHDVFSACRKTGDIGILLLHNQLDIVKNRLAIVDETVKMLITISKQMRELGYLDFQTMQPVKRNVFTVDLTAFQELVKKLQQI